MTLKQYWSRVGNAHAHLGSNSQDGERSRKEMFRLTKQTKYTQKNYLKNFAKGKVYTKREIARDVSKVEKMKTSQLKTQWKKVKGTNKTRLKSFKQFRRVNRHMTVTDFSEIEFIYDSP